MFGMTMKIDGPKISLTLRAFRKEEIPLLVDGFSSMKVHMWTGQIGAQTLENEKEWYERARNSENSYYWCIVPEDSEDPIGTTGIHRLDIHGSCTSGIVIWDPKWWGKGVASAAHLARTLYAADYLNRFTIKSAVRTNNPASLKALMKVGYSVIGKEPRTFFRAGAWIDTYLLTWLHPERVAILFESKVPDEYLKGIKNATKSLEEARKIVSFP